MSDNDSSVKKYLLVFGLGAIGGGILIAWATKSMPKMMSRMMQNMMAQMQKGGCNPKEM